MNERGFAIVMKSIAKPHRMNERGPHRFGASHCKSVWGVLRGSGNPGKIEEWTWKTHFYLHKEVQQTPAFSYISFRSEWILNWWTQISSSCNWWHVDSWIIRRFRRVMIETRSWEDVFPFSRLLQLLRCKVLVQQFWKSVQNRGFPFHVSSDARAWKRPDLQN